MAEVKQYDINALYRVLKKHDVEILKHYNDETVSDNDYFFYGINSDIISSCLRNETVLYALLIDKSMAQRHAFIRK